MGITIAKHILTISIRADEASTPLHDDALQRSIRDIKSKLIIAGSLSTCSLHTVKCLGFWKQHTSTSTNEEVLDSLNTVSPRGSGNDCT